MTVPLAARAPSSVKPRQRRAAESLPDSQLALQQNAHPQIDRGKQQELNPHAGERMRVSVVLRVGAARDDGALPEVIGHRHHRRRGRAGRIEPLDRLQQAAKCLALFGWHRARVELAQSVVHQRASLRAREHLLSYRFHHVPDEHPANHRRFRRARWIEEHLELRARAAGEKRTASRVTEPVRDHHGDRQIACLYPASRLGGRRRGHGQAGVLLHRGDNRAGDGARVLIDNGHCNPGRLAGLVPDPPKIEPKNEAMAIGTAKLRITARRSPKNSSRSLRTSAAKAPSPHQSLRLLPVRLRNNVSSETCPSAPAGMRARSPAHACRRPARAHDP